MTTVIDEKLNVYKKYQSDLQGLYTQKQQILLQLNENTLVKGELDMLEENAGVYKLVGPVLITVDIHEAKENVSKRLQFIEGEISKIEAAITSKQTDMTNLGDEIAQIQQKMQAEAASAARGLVGDLKA